MAHKGKMHEGARTEPETKHRALTLNARVEKFRQVRLAEKKELARRNTPLAPNPRKRVTI